MKRQETKALVFDLGEVFIRLDFSEVMRLLSKTPVQSMSEWLKTMDQWKVYDQYERGRVDSEAFYKHVNERLPAPLSWEEFTKVWSTVLREGVSEAEEILSSVKKSFSIFALTNANALHYDEVMTRYPFMGHFRKVFSSHLLGCRKPELEIYRAVEKEIGFSSSEIFFVDDRPENVEGAKKAGWEAELIQRDPSNLKQVLNARGFF